MDKVGPLAETGPFAVPLSSYGFAKAVFGGTILNGRIVKIEGKQGDQVRRPGRAPIYVWRSPSTRNRTPLPPLGPTASSSIDANGKAQVYSTAMSRISSPSRSAKAAYFTPGRAESSALQDHGARARLCAYDFPGERRQSDTRSVRKGKVLAISNEYAELPEIRTHGTGRRARGTGRAVPRPKPGRGTLTAFDADGRLEKLLRRDDTHFHRSRRRANINLTSAPA